MEAALNRLLVDVVVERDADGRCRRDVYRAANRRVIDDLRRVPAARGD
jgi:hypothetical protein